MRPLILLTNDDGIHSPGLKAAAVAVAPLGDLLIVAPRFQQTAMGRSLPRFPDGGIIEVFPLDIAGIELTVYGVHGSPASAVRHAMLELAPRRPDLCISGINYGENMGASMTSSGTVGAALEATGFGVPSIAISAETDSTMHYDHNYGVVDWATASFFTHRFAELVLQRGLGSDIQLLNINVPHSATPETPSRATIQSRFNYYVTQKPEPGRDFSKPYQITDKATLKGTAFEPESDVIAFAQDGVVSVTPLVATMTAPVELDRWFTELVMPVR